MRECVIRYSVGCRKSTAATQGRVVLLTTTCSSAFLRQTRML